MPDATQTMEVIRLISVAGEMTLAATADRLACLDLAAENQAVAQLQAKLEELTAAEERALAHGRDTIRRLSTGAARRAVRGGSAAGRARRG